MPVCLDGQRLLFSTKEKADGVGESDFLENAIVGKCQVHLMTPKELVMSMSHVHIICTPKDQNNVRLALLSVLWGIIEAFIIHLYNFSLSIFAINSPNVISACENTNVVICGLP